MTEDIVIRGARVNNLADITLRIPRGKFVVITGVSGSGKSSLAFDTLYAEGQRRFAQSLSSYSRQFLGRMSKPDVDSIEGIPPAVAIEQKVNVKNPRSTVATTTEIYDYLRLIFTRAGHTFSPVSGREVHADDVRDVTAFMQRTAAFPMLLSTDLNWQTRPDKVECLLGLKEQGFSRLLVDGKPVRIEQLLENQDDPVKEVRLLIDRFSSMDDRTRLLESIATAFKTGDGRLALDLPDGSRREFCNRMELDGITFRKSDDFLFSFNSPLGACPVCGGLGKIMGISEDLVVPDKTLSIYDGAIACWRGEKMGWFKDHLIEYASEYHIDIFKPYCQLDEKTKELIWAGDTSKAEDDPTRLVGIDEFFRWVETQRYKIQYKFMLNRFSGRSTCHACHGTRLRPEALYVKVNGKTIAEILDMTVTEALDFFQKIELSDTEREVVKEPLSEILNRLEYIQDVGLGYLTLSRNCNTLSGGESQRINLVAALGSSLVGSMYILDEPSIGLHPRDTQRLISVLKRLRDIGNTVIVVEHDEEIIRSADVLIDLGPGAGTNGGRVIYEGSTADAGAADIDNSLTLAYLTGRKPRYRRTPRTWQYSICVEGAMEHNLKDITVKFPLGVLTVVSGVSGSGKSSLVGDILYPAVYRYLNEAGDKPGTFKRLSGNLDRISGVEYVDQNPIGRSTRSNPATYLKVWDLIRKILSDQQYAKINGFSPAYFSFNQDGGRCPECQGEGIVRIEMQFMSDVTMVCEECHGKRFKPEVLQVRYRGMNVDDLLNMTVAKAISFFREDESLPEAQEIASRLTALVDVGLGYLKLGQSSTTLSGGESQRIKLAYFLAMSREKRGHDRILFIFDEPTTGLHFSDVEKLLHAFDSLLECGHSIIVVEHNLDVIRSADWIIDMGPDAGANGGRVVYQGTPADLHDTFTAEFINQY